MLSTELVHIQLAQDTDQEARVPAETAQVLPWLGFKHPLPFLVACPAKGASVNSIQLLLSYHLPSAGRLRTVAGLQHGWAPSAQISSWQTSGRPELPVSTEGKRGTQLT